MESVELSIIMPCLNEAETLEVCIRKAKAFLEKSGVSGEVLIGDNGSTDGSLEIAAKAGVRVVPVAVRGYGAALYFSTLQARGRYIVMGDSDDSYDFSNLMPFVEQLREGFGLVMGNRFKGGIAPGAMPWKNRWLGNPVLTGIGRFFFRTHIGDFHCGLRGYSKAAFEKMDLRAMGMEFASEMVIKAHLLGVKVTEVPTTLSKDGRSRPPHLRPWRDGWRHLRLMLLFCPKWLFFVPGMLLMALGLFVGSLIWANAIWIDGIAFDVNTLVYAAMAVEIGYQSVTFAIFTKVFAISEGLLPEDHRLNRLFRWVTLESGLVVGVVLLICGLIGSYKSLLLWKHAAYGTLNPTRSLRSVVPSALALTLGFQTILSSFFLSVLGMRIKKKDLV